MNKLAALCLTLCLGLMPYAAMAGRYDGSVPLICAAIEAIECDVGVECQRGTAESIDFPQFVKIDFQEKTLSTLDEGDRRRTTPIKNLERMNGSLIMQGVEGSRAWNLLITQATGKMSATVADDQVGFVIFGACTPF
jgi:hypothetical protein